MKTNKIGVAAASLAAFGAIVAGGAAMANAADTTPSTSASSSAAANSGTSTDTTKTGPQHTAATTAETAKVTAAVKAKDSTVTVTSVEKDADGSYDVHGTRAGAQVTFDVTTDLATITERTGGPGGGHGGGMGGTQDTPVTGAAADKVIAAVKAKYAAVTVTSVRMDPDGSYDALGTKAGAPVMVQVSKDLSTIEVQTGGPGGDRGAASSGAS